MQKRYVIYRIENQKNGKSYVGLTYNFKERKASHLNQIKKGIHCNGHLQNAFRKHGTEAFKWFILESNLNEEQALEAEIKWIAFYDGFNDGYNQTKGGDAIGLNAKPCVWEGIPFDSIVAAAEFEGVADTTMKKYIQHGYTCRADIPKQGYNFKKPLVWEGIPFESREAVAEFEGVARKTVYEWLERGYTCRADIPKNPVQAMPLVWEGMLFGSQTAAADFAGVNKTTMGRWLERGYTCMADVPKEDPVVWEAISFESIPSAAQFAGVKWDTMARWLELGYTCMTDVPDKSKRHTGKRGRRQRPQK